MDLAKTNITRHVNALVIRYSLTVPPSFTLIQEDFNDEDLIQSFRHATLEQKQPFFSKCFRSNVSLANQAFPLDVNLFNEETKLVVSMLSSS